MGWAQPAPPSGLAVVAPYDGEVDLVLTPNPPVTSYLISRQRVDLVDTPTPTPTGTLPPTPALVPIATVLLTAIPAPGTPVYRDFQVTNGESYLYQVWGQNSGVTGTAASVIARPYMAPVAVQPLTVQNIHDDALDLSWGIPNSSYPVSYYQIYRYPYPTYTYTFTITPTPTKTSTNTFSPSATATITNTSTDSPTGTLTPISTDTPTNSATSTPSFTTTPSPTSTYTATNTFVFTATSTPTSTWTWTPTFPPPPASFATVVAGAKPIATVFVNSYSDTTAGSSLALAYYYLVYAVDSLGDTGSQPTYVPTPALPHPVASPGPPVLSALVSLGANPIIGTNGYGARLFWTGGLSSEGVTAYQVLQNSTPIANIAYSTPTATMVYDDTTLTEGNGAVPVTYSVKAMNGYGTSTSNSADVSIVAANEATNIQVVPVATANAVSLLWAPATPGTYGLKEYRIYRGFSGVPVADPSPIPAGSPPPTLTPMPVTVVSVNAGPAPTLVAVDTSIQNHASYWVEPVDLTDHGGSINSAIPPSLNLAPTPPSNVGVANPVGNNQIAVSWTAGTPGFYGTPVDYVIYRELLTNPTPTPVAIATVPATQLSYIDSVSGPVSTGVGYQVALVDSAGNTSDVASFGNSVSLIAVTAPSTPVILPVGGSVAAIELSWLGNPTGDAVSAYSVFAINGTPTWTPTGTSTPAPTATPVIMIVAAQTPGPALAYVPNPVQAPWAPAYYSLVAQNSQGLTAAATLSGIAVPAYTVTVLMTPGTRQFPVSWNMAPVTAAITPDIDSYGIYRSLSPAATLTPIATVAIGTNNYVDVIPTATAGITYYYHVTARAGGAISQLAESPQISNPDTYAGILAWPNAPAGVSVLSTANSTTLYWAANNAQEAVTSYSVFLNGGATPLTTVAAGAGTVYSASNPEVAGNLSSYHVVANNAAGPSDSSQTLNVLVPPSINPVISLSQPPTQTYVPVASVTPGVWISGLSYPGAVSDYSIFKQSVPVTSTPGTPPVSPTYFFVGAVPLGTATPVFEDLNPTPGYVNNYQVVADNGAGVTAASAASAQLSVTLWPVAPIPTLLPNATPVTVSTNSVTVSWAPPVGNVTPSSYDIYRNVYPTTTPVLITTTATSAVSYIDSGVTTGVPYLYWMDAQNAAGGVSLFSAPSTIVPFAAPALGLTPLPERNQLVWAPISVPTASPVTGYAIYRAVVTPSVPPNFTQLSIVEPLSNTTVVDSQSVTDGYSYIYEIAPCTSNGAILGAFSNPVTVTPLPQPVANLVAVSGDGLVQLRWNFQGVATNSFLITRQLGTALSSAPLTLKTNFQGVNFTDSGVVDKNFYVYTVTTVDANGLVSTSSSAVTALPAKPPMLGSTTVTVAQNSSNAQTLIGNTLSWQAADFSPPNQLNFDPTTMYPLGGYVIYRSEDGGAVYNFSDFPPVILPVTLTGGVPVNPLSYFDQVPLVGGKTYTYLVQAFDQPPDLPVPLSQAVTEGLVHETSYQPVNAYPISPNTALDRNAIRPFGAANEKIVNIRFVVTSPGNVDIKVYTLDGTYVSELVNQNYSQPGIYWTSWDAHNRFGSMVASGVYLITTESPGGHQEFDKVAVIK